MNTQSLVRLAPTALALLLASSPAVAQRPAGAAFESQRRAAEVVRQAVAAHGGEAAIRGMRGVELRWEGSAYLRTQGRDAAKVHAPVPDPLPSSNRLLLDLQRGRGRREIDATLPGGYVNRPRIIVAGRQLLSYDAGRIFSGDALSRDTLGVQAQATLGSMYDALPQLLLRAVLLGRLHTLRDLGAATGAGGRAQRVVTYTTPEGRQTTLHFDAATKLLSRMELLGDDPVFGDAVAATEFSAYERAAGGMMVPRLLRARQNGELTSELRLTQIAFDPALGDSLFQAPAGYVEVPPRAGGPTVTRAGEHVYFVEGLGGGYRSMFVDTGDSGVVALDAPLSPAVTEQAIALIARTLPGRPIRYVALTHHHSDHVAGVRAYVARGVTVLAPPGTEAYLRELLAAKHTFTAPDSLARAPRPAVIQTVTGRRTIGSGDRAVELLDLSPTSHAAGMIAAYVPSQKLLFQGDMLRLNTPGAILPALDVTMELDQAIRRLGLDVQTIAAVHGRNGTIEELREAVGKRQ